jgi:hypothetical protein
MLQTYSLFCNRSNEIYLITLQPTFLLNMSLLMRLFAESQKLIIEKKNQLDSIHEKLLAVEEKWISDQILRYV